MLSRPRTPFLINPALQSFRGEARATVDLHPLEKALLVIICAHLGFTVWALGGVYNWSQFISLGFAIAGLLVSLINREYSEDEGGIGAFKLIMWPKLIRFPIFWIGLAFLGYITVQALNPAWISAGSGYSAWLVPVEHITWLPTSILAPFEKMNAWHALMLYATPWLAMCAAWVGFTRRITVQHLFTFVVANGAVLTLIGILQRVTGSYKILWCIQPKTGPVFATILYKNHAGAYLNLVFMLCIALFYRHFARGERRLERANPAPVFAFIAILIGMGVLLTVSRAATLLLIGFVLVSFIGFIVRCALTRGEGRSPMVVGLLCGGFAFFIGIGAYFLNIDRSFSRLGNLIENGSADSSVSSRLIARQAAWDMAKDSLVTGWGAGSFRYAFPPYQKQYPEITVVPGRPGVTYRWEHAHNDYVELLDELGLIGAGMLLAALGCGVYQLWSNHILMRPHLLLIALSLAATLAHAFVDFPSRHPATMLLWCVSAVLLSRWAELENQRQ
jgi:O-antigen ligase